MALRRSIKEFYSVYTYYIIIIASKSFFPQNSNLQQIKQKLKQEKQIDKESSKNQTTATTKKPPTIKQNKIQGKKTKEN